MFDVFRTKHYLLDPHGAIGYLGLREYLKGNANQTGIFLETAHPAKFKDVVQDAIGDVIAIPEKLQGFLTKKKTSIAMKNSFRALKEFLLR